MASRIFTDDAGVAWTVLAVTPMLGLETSMPGGWLAFQAGDERRRLAPIPRGWEDASNVELGVWWRSARIIGTSGARPSEPKRTS
jgi:hypothetical protein